MGLQASFNNCFIYSLTRTHTDNLIPKSNHTQKGKNGRCNLNKKINIMSTTLLPPFSTRWC